MKTIRITAIVLAVFASITACKKDEKETLDFDYQSAVDNSLAEGIYSDVNNISNQAVENGNTGLATYRTGEGNGLLSVCATVTVTPTVQVTAAARWWISEVPIVFAVIIVTVVAAYWSIIPDVIAIPPRSSPRPSRIIMSVPIQAICTRSRAARR